MRGAVALRDGECGVVAVAAGMPRAAAAGEGRGEKQGRAGRQRWAEVRWRDVDDGSDADGVVVADDAAGEDEGGVDDDGSEVRDGRMMAGVGVDWDGARLGGWDDDVVRRWQDVSTSVGRTHVWTRAGARGELVAGEQRWADVTKTEPRWRRQDAVADAAGLEADVKLEGGRRQ